MNYRTVGYLERGESEPFLSTAWEISDFFEVPLEAVFSREEFPPLSEELYRKGS